MKRLTFYKPNSKNTGSAFQASLGRKNDELFFKIIKQVSWDDEKRRGSFKENAVDPSKNLSVKLNAVEAASIIQSINTKSEFKAFHKSKNQTVIISFNLMMDKNTNQEKGFSLRMIKESAGNSTQNTSFIMGFYPNEALILKLFLEEYIKGSFEQAIQSHEEAPEGNASSDPPQKANQNITNDNDDW
jgi:hypothetical protein